MGAPYFLSFGDTMELQMPNVHSIEDLFSCPVTLVVSQQRYNFPKKSTTSQIIGER